MATAPNPLTKRLADNAARHLADAEFLLAGGKHPAAVTSAAMAIEEAVRFHEAAYKSPPAAYFISGGRGAHAARGQRGADIIAAGETSTGASFALVTDYPTSAGAGHADPLAAKQARGTAALQMLRARGQSSLADAIENNAASEGARVAMMAQVRQLAVYAEEHTTPLDLGEPEARGIL